MGRRKNIYFWPSGAGEAQVAEFPLGINPRSPAGRFDEDEDDSVAAEDMILKLVCYCVIL